MLRKWNSKRIAFISILIAMSISFVIIGAQAFAISSFPSFKLSLVGLPVKIVGFLFGPLTGLLVGITTDILSFVFVPIFYHPLYSVALGITGMLPGFFSFIFRFITRKTSDDAVIDKLVEKRINFEHLYQKAFIDDDMNNLNLYDQKIQEIKNKILEIKNGKQKIYRMNLVLIISVILVAIILVGVSVSTFFGIPDSAINDFVLEKNLPSFFENKFAYLGLIWIAGGTSVFVLFICRFKMKERTFFDFAPILLFVLATEYINLVVIAFADEQTIHLDFIISYISSLLTSPIKVWMNLLIITFAIKIVLPLIEKKTFNGYAQ